MANKSHLQLVWSAGSQVPSAAPLDAGAFDPIEDDAWDQALERGYSQDVYDPMDDAVTELFGIHCQLEGDPTAQDRLLKQTQELAARWKKHIIQRIDKANKIVRVK